MGALFDENVRNIDKRGECVKRDLLLGKQAFRYPLSHHIHMNWYWEKISRKSWPYNYMRYHSGLPRNMMCNIKGTWIVQSISIPSTTRSTKNMTARLQRWNPLIGWEASGRYSVSGAKYPPYSGMGRGCGWGVSTLVPSSGSPPFLKTSKLSSSTGMVKNERRIIGLGKIIMPHGWVRMILALNTSLTIHSGWCSGRWSIFLGTYGR